jgi:hypothetical protein
VSQYRQAYLSVSCHFWLKCILSKAIKECGKKDARGWSSLTDLRPSRRVHRAVGLLGLHRRGTKVTHSSQNRGRDGSPSLLPRHTGWIDVVDVRAWSPLIVSGALRGLDGEKAEAPSAPRTIPDVGSEWPLHFSPTV